MPGYSTQEKGNYRSFKSHQVMEAIVMHWPDKPPMFNPVVKYLKPLFKEKVISRNVYFFVNANTLAPRYNKVSRYRKNVCYSGVFVIAKTPL